MPGENELQLGMSVDIQQAIKDVEKFGVGFKKAVVGAQREFDGVNVSAKDLQDRIADIDVRMKKLIETEGKHAANSKTYIMLQRERGMALEQLTTMEEKNAVAAQKSVRGLGSLGSASIAALGSISGLGTGVSVLTNSLMSGVGLTAGLATGVIALSLFMESVRGAREETEKMNRVITNLIKVNMPEGTFNIDPTKIKETITRIKAQMQIEKTLDVPQVQGFGGTPIAVESDHLRERNKVYEKALEILQQAQKEYDQYLKIVGVLTSSGMALTQEEEKKAEQHKKTKASVDILTESYRRLIEAISNRELLTVLGKGTTITGPFKMTEVPVPTKPELGEIKKEYDEITNAAIDAGRAQISAWTSSLNLIKRNQTMVEQLINAIGRAITEYLALKAAMAVVDYFSGGIFGAIFGSSSGGGASAAMKPTPSSSLVPSYSASYGTSRTVVMPVVLDTQMRGRDIWLVNRKQTDYRNRFT